MKVDGEALGASTHLGDARELWGSRDPVGPAFVSAEPPNSPSAQAPWPSAAPAPLCPGSPEPRDCSRWHPRATSAFQLCGGCIPTRQSPSLLPASPRARPQLPFWALTWASPRAVLGVRASPDPAAVRGSERGRRGGEWRSSVGSPLRAARGKAIDWDIGKSLFIRAAGGSDRQSSGDGRQSKAVLGGSCRTVP